MHNQGQTQGPRARQTAGSEASQPQIQSTESAQSDPRPFRHQHSEESWIEIGSRPSSSSLSSAADEIITTGLRVQHDSNLHRRRRRSMGQFRIGGHGGGGHRETGGGSSQEEYEESESESDRVMTSSSEGLGPSPLQQEIRRPSRNAYSVASSETEGDDEDDENATAVNYPRSSARGFEPRPTVFSHPPTAPAVGLPEGQNLPSRRPAARPSSQRHSYPQQHLPFTAMSPAHQADHDEALRASLSTLLSAAAAVRGLPKPGQPRTLNTGNPSTRVDPTTLRLVPESVALGEVPEEGTASSSPLTPSSPSTGNSPQRTSPIPAEKSKRKANISNTATANINTHIRSTSKDRRMTKKARRTGPVVVDEISPTLLTWVVSAGVVVLVSALSFSAGYVVGKEAGHAEALGQLGGAGSEAGRCGKEAAGEIGRAGLGLRRLRWSGGSGVRV
ncbi:hypothetical protein BCR34DRAFT_371261 [Clohesyomyces aquaticus]|uniref:Uncharacterized protein n=1 Tax=Clohesyomyces aquaticus TaxID=1231657 RepID=A0A1Y1ZHZ5_9PLEO|nr:hypothetical protein BCR34DRAFT_371261 [Clohesyomyces aquaticus]